MQLQPTLRDLLIGAIAVLWGGGALLRSYFQVRNQARAEAIGKLKAQYGDQATIKVCSGWPRLLGIRVGTGGPSFGALGSGSGGGPAVRALESLQGTIAQVKFNPADPQSVREAIRQYDAELDAKLGPYLQNKMIAKTSEKLKREFRQTVEEQVRKFTRSAAKHS